MAVTRINNNQISDASAGNVYVGINASTKLQPYSITSTKLANNLTYGSDLTVTGNLTVQGNTTAIDTTYTTVEDPILLLASNQTGAPSVDIGFVGQRGTSDNIAFVWDESADEFVTVFTTTGESNTTVSIASYADLHTGNANIGSNLTVNGTTTLIGNVTGNLSVTGNISAPYFIGDIVGNITGNIDAGGANTQVQFNDNELLNGSAGFTFDKTSNAVVVTGNVSSANLNATANVVSVGVAASGNVAGGNLLTGGLVEATGNITSSANVAGANVIASANLVSVGAVVSGNVTGGNLLTAGLISATGNITSSANVAGANVIASANLVSVGAVVSGNVTGGNLLTGGLVEATGNIVSVANINGANLNITNGVRAATGYFTGNVDVLGNLNASIGVVYANSGIFYGDVVTGNGAAYAGVPGFTPLGSNVVMQFGGNVDSYSQINFQNINTGTSASTDYIATADNGTDGTYYVDLGINSSTFDDPVDYPGFGPNDAYVHNHGGNLILNPESAGKAINFMVGGTDTTDVIGYVDATGLSVTGIVSASGNVSGANLNTAGKVVATGNLESSGNVTGANLVASAAVTATGNVTGGNLVTGGLVSATGNITSSANINGGNLAVTGTITSATIDTTGNVVVGGNLIVQGNIQYINVDDLRVEDPIIIMGTGPNGAPLTSPDSMDRGIYMEWYKTGLGNSWIGWENSSGNLIAAADVVFSSNNVVGVNSYGTFQTGNIYAESAVTTGNITGGNLLTAGLISATGNITGGNLLTGGYVSATGNVYTPRVVNGGTGMYMDAGFPGYVQFFNSNGTTVTIGDDGNIVSTGNVSGTNILTGGIVSATGNITGGNLITAGIVSATGNVNGGGATFLGNVTAQNFIGNISGNIDAGGANTQVQFNDNDILNGTAGFTFDKTSNAVVITGNISGANLVTAGIVDATGNVLSAANISGANIIASANIVSVGAAVAGNITGGNLLTAGLVSATGNIISSANISGANVIASANLVSVGAVVSGNITGGNLISNGNILATSAANVTFGDNTWFYSGYTTLNTSGIFHDTGANPDTIQVSTNSRANGIALVTVGLANSFVVSTGGFEFVTGGTLNANTNPSGGTSTVQITSTGITTGANITATGNVSGANVIGTTSVTGGNIVISGDDITDTNGRVNFNSAGGDVDFAINGDTLANVFYVDAGTGTASFGSSTQTTNSIVAFNATNSILMPVGNTGQRPGTGVTGMLRFNSTVNGVEVFNSTEWATVGTPSFTVISDEQFNGDGSTVAFTLSAATTTNSTIVSINGIVQIPTIAYSVGGGSSDTLTFTEAPETGDIIDVRILTTTTQVVAISNSPGNAVIEVNPTINEVNVTGNLVPTSNALQSLGSPTAQWKDIYVSGNTIYLGGLLLEASGNTFSVYTADGVTQANIDVGSIDVSSITSGTSAIGISGTNGNAYITVGGTSNVVVFTTSGLSVSGNITNGGSNGVGNIGSSTTYFNTVFAKATSAQYADLAEAYAADAVYEPGTVVSFGGEREVTLSTIASDTRIAGVISTNPSYVMNATLDAECTAIIALTGRVPTKVTGQVSKGDMMVSAGNGRAIACATPAMGTVIGKALENHTGGDGVIEVVVGRL